MRQFAAITVALLIVACGGAPPRAASSPTPTLSPVSTPSPSRSVAPVATAVNGITSTLFAVGQFHAFDAASTAYSGSWQSLVNTKGESDVWMLENRIAPGGSFGWHSHPGPSLVVVKIGALTLYRANDPSCKPQLVEAGSGFVDPGGDVHLVRNEGSVETVVYVMSLVPHGSMRKIDEAQPTNCPGIL